MKKKLKSSSYRQRKMTDKELEKIELTLHLPPLKDSEIKDVDNLFAFTVGWDAGNKDGVLNRLLLPHPINSRSIESFSKFIELGKIWYNYMKQWQNNEQLR